MSNDGTDIFDLAARRLGWIGQRQALLAQNVANASTPGYAARDLAPFKHSLSAAAGTLATTEPGHMPGASQGWRGSRVRPAERAPDGNSISMDEQLTKIADTNGAQALTVNLYHKYLGLYRTVLGK